MEYVISLIKKWTLLGHSSFQSSGHLATATEITNTPSWELSIDADCVLSWKTTLYLVALWSIDVLNSLKYFLFHMKLKWI